MQNLVDGRGKQGCWAAPQPSGVRLRHLGQSCCRPKAFCSSFCVITWKEPSDYKALIEEQQPRQNSVEKRKSEIIPGTRQPRAV